MTLKQLQDVSGKTVTVDVPRRRGGKKKEKRRNGNGKTWSIGHSLAPVKIVMDATFGIPTVSTGFLALARDPSHGIEDALRELVNVLALETTGTVLIASPNFSGGATPFFAHPSMPTANLSVAIGGAIAHKAASKLGVNARLGAWTKMLTGYRIVI